jgi:hypothetical protein
MKLVYAIFAENADRLKDGRLCLFGADFDTFHVEETPVVIPFHLLAKIAFEAGENFEGHSVSLEITNPVGERTSLLHNGALPMIVTRPKHFPTDTPPFANIHIRLAVNFSNPGIYRFLLLVDDNELTSAPLNIVVAPSSDATES